MPNWKRLYEDTWNELVSLKTKNASLEIENQALSKKNEQLLKGYNEKQRQLKSLNGKRKHYRILKQTKFEYEKQMQRMKRTIKRLKYECSQNISIIKLLKKELDRKVNKMTGLENDIICLKNDKYITRIEHKLEKHLRTKHIDDIRSNYTATNVLDYTPSKKRRRVNNHKERWSYAEYKAVMTGYSRHGNQWNKIKNDKELKEIFSVKRTPKDIQSKFKYLTEKKGWNPKDSWLCAL